MPSFQPDDFLNLFNQFNRIADLAVAIISDPLGFAGKVGEVLQTGVENFVKPATLAMYLQQGLFQWATKCLMGVTIPTDGTLPNTVRFARWPPPWRVSC